MSNGIEPSGDFLVCLTKELDEVTNNVPITTVEEGGGTTSVTGTTGATNTVNIVIDVGRKIKVDDVGNVGDIETTGSNGGGNHDRSVTLAEGLKGHFTFSLGPVTMNGCSRVVVGDEVVAQNVGRPLRLNKDKSQTAPGFHGEDVQEDGALIGILDVLDFLSNVFGGGSNTSNGEEDVFLEEIFG